MVDIPDTALINSPYPGCGMGIAIPPAWYSYFVGLKPEYRFHAGMLQIILHILAEKHIIL